MSFVYKTISSNIDSLNSGSFYDQSELDNVLSGSAVDKYFGTSEEDKIEFSIYDIDGNLKKWDILPVNPIYNVITSTYKDVDQNVLTYEYKKYNSGYIFSFDRNILLDAVGNLNASNMAGGNSVLSYNFVRNIGTPDNKLVIKNISVSRNEVQLIPSFKVNKHDEQNVLINLELCAFAQKKILLRDIIPIMISELEKYQIYSHADDVISDNKSTFLLMRTTFGFKTDLDVINFLNDIYVGFNNPIYGNDNQVIFDVFDGILNYIKNWSYTNYKKILSREELLDEIKYIVNRATEIRLNKYNIFFGKNEITKKIITDFITSICYDSFIKLVISNTTKDYSERFHGYLQNALNFGNNSIYTILNYSGYIEDGMPVIIVKMMESLPQSVTRRIKRAKCWPRR